MPFASTVAPSAVLLGPVISLNAWTFLMEGWMYYCRIRAVNSQKMKLDNTLTKHEFDKQIPPQLRWKADNYNHLFEQPTQFYAVALTLAMLGAESRTDVGLAWGYVGLRLVHSMVHSTTNPIMRRFQLYIVMSGVLATMTVRAGLMLLKRVT